MQDFLQKNSKKEEKVSRREGTATIKHTTYMDETKKQHANSAPLILFVIIMT